MIYLFHHVRNAGTRKGYMSIEAAFIIPMLLLIAVTLIYLFMHLYEREYLRGELYQDSCSIPHDVQDEDIGAAAYLNGIAPEDVYLYGSVRRDVGCSSGDITISGGIDFKVESAFTVKRETGKCSGRLRRWQLYESITEE